MVTSTMDPSPQFKEGREEEEEEASMEEEVVVVVVVEGDPGREDALAQVGEGEGRQVAVVVVECE